MKVTLTPEPNTERTDMTDLSADLALADAEARASRERERFEAWAKTQSWPHYWHDGVGMAFNARSFEAWQAALAPAVPPGWKMVPVEPTPEMLMADLGLRQWDSIPIYESRLDLRPAIWKAMLKAAPSAKEPAQ